MQDFTMLFERLYAAEIGSQKCILSLGFFLKEIVFNTPNPKAMDVKDSGSLSLTPNASLVSEPALIAMEPLFRCKTTAENKC